MNDHRRINATILVHKSLYSYKNLRLPSKNYYYSIPSKTAINSTSIHSTIDNVCYYYALPTSISLFQKIPTTTVTRQKFLLLSSYVTLSTPLKLTTAPKCHKRASVRNAPRARHNLARRYICASVRKCYGYGPVPFKVDSAACVVSVVA
jgi:hypothetical protein